MSTVSEIDIKDWDRDQIIGAGQILQDECHGDAKKAGWWEGIEGPLVFSNKLMLTVSELAEAMEADRKGLMDDKLTHRDGREVELADAVIRIFDLAGAFGFNLGEAIAEKLDYNQQRSDHKREVRSAAGGKKY